MLLWRWQAAQVSCLHYSDGKRAIQQRKEKGEIKKPKESGKEQAEKSKAAQ